jgi:molybdopterin converting factor small subunit
MQVTVWYMAQLKQAAGKASEQLELDNPCTLRELAQRLADRHGESLRRLLFDPGGALQPTNLFFVGDTQVQPADSLQLKDGDEITILSPIAGGAPDH